MTKSTPSMLAITSTKRADLSYGDISVGLLVILALLNVNNVVYMMTGERQVTSLLMLALALVGLITAGRHALRTPFLVFLLALLVYLLLGTFYSLASHASFPSAVWLRYGATVLIVWTVAGYAIGEARGPGMINFLRFVHIILLTSVGTVWLTPLLLPLWNFLPLAFESRLSGVFANPNEAGFVCAAALAFSIFLPVRSRRLKFLLVAFAMGGVLLSFSKSAVAVSFLILSLGLLHSVRGSAILGAIALALAGLLVVPNLPSIVRWTAAQSALPLDRAQRERVDEFGVLLSGQFNEQVTTGRVRIWDVGTERIAGQLPHGSGLDTFLELEGGLINPATETWQGVHNVFLLILGEAGIVPFLALTAFFLIVFLRVLARPTWPLAGALVLIILADFNSNHSALAARYSNIILGVLIALVCLRARPSARAPIARQA